MFFFWQNVFWIVIDFSWRWKGSNNLYSLSFLFDIYIFFFTKIKQCQQLGNKNVVFWYFLRSKVWFFCFILIISFKFEINNNGTFFNIFPIYLVLVCNKNRFPEHNLHIFFQIALIIWITILNLCFWYQNQKSFTPCPSFTLSSYENKAKVL